MKLSVMALLLCTLLLAGCGDRYSLPGVPKEESSPPSSSSSQSAAPPAGNDFSIPKHADVELPSHDGDVVEIREKMFIAQSNDIYLNSDEYMGKTIKYEGLFKSMYLESEGKDHYFVLRYGPGCCGYDGEAGFEVTGDFPWPQEDDWCEAVGVLESYELEGCFYLRLALTSLTVLEERGAEFVSQ